MEFQLAEERRIDSLPRECTMVDDIKSDGGSPMGLLDIFKQSDRTFTDKWKKETRRFYTGDGFHDNRLTEKFLGEMYSEIGKGMENPVNDPPKELRGYYRNLPARMKYQTASYEATYVIYNGSFNIEIKAEMPLDARNAIISGGNNDGIIIWRDPKEVPAKCSPGDPWRDGDITRIFLAQGIYIKGPGNQAKTGVALFERFTEPLRSAILGSIDAMSMEFLELGWNKIGITIGLDSFHALDDPVGYVLRGLDLLCEIAKEITTMNTADLQ